MKRTAKDVVDEWRNSVVNNDDGELVSRINYWAVTDFCPSFAPHPGLGSGALREALELMVKEWHWYAGKHGLGPARLQYALGVGERALSLSSPIEPPPTDRAKKIVDELVMVAQNIDNDTLSRNWQIWATNAIANELARPTPQASSEIREALEKLASIVEEAQKHVYLPVEIICASDAVRRAKDALAPSRQGAAK